MLDRGGLIETNELTEKIIGCAIKVHRKLGAGFLESVYRSALGYAFSKAGLRFEREKALSVPYEEIVLDAGFRCDFLVEDYSSTSMFWYSRMASRG